MREPDPAESARFADLAEHPKLAELSRLVATALLEAAAARRLWSRERVEELCLANGLSEADGNTADGNPLGDLLAPDQASGERRLRLGWLLGAALRDRPLETAEARRTLGVELAWLSAHSPVDGLGALEQSGRPDRAAIWSELADWALAVDRGEAVGGDRASLLALLQAARSATAAAAARAELRAELDDARYQAVLMADRSPAPAELRGGASERAAQPTAESTPDGAPLGGAVPGDEVVAGELVAPPARLWLLVLGALTGLLLLWWLARLVGWLVLRLRRPAELSVSARGVTIRSQTELMGRTLRRTEQHIPVENLARAVRETRYPRLAVYVGLICLAVGSYVGVSLWIDGARAASPSLLGFGALAFGLGIGVDLLGSVLLPTRAGRTRLLLVPRTGRALALRTAEAARAGDALRRLATRS